ncbi:MAG: hypothetical protein D6788_03190 [Planctomycetota bacterium]|nr:MAG: hypothetical protein D6788_03190 [Planctomycetota bacterium]
MGNEGQHETSRRTLRWRRLGVRVGVLAAALSAGCFNPAFVNTFVGGEVPLTPGPSAAFVMVRCVNETGQPVQFIVTIEREVLVTDEQGNFQVDEQGNFITRPERETVRLTTAATGDASELGTLFSCNPSPVTKVGLGENLLPTDIGAFVGGQGASGAAGFGVSAAGVNPLELEVGNFNCGDTIIFRAFLATGVPGGVALQSFLLPGSEQPSIFSGPNTFANLEAFLESQARENQE